MTEQKESLTLVLPSRTTDHRAQILEEILEVVDRSYCTARLAVALVVVPVDGEPRLHQSAGNMLVTAAMLTEPMRQHQRRLGRPVRTPATHVDGVPPRPYEFAFLISHFSHFFLRPWLTRPRENPLFIIVNVILYFTVILYPTG